MHITFDIDIDAPQDCVWSFLDDDDKRTQWMTEIVDITYPDGRDRENPVGTRFRQKQKEGGRVTDYPGVVTAHEPPRLLGIQIGEGSFLVDMTYALERKGAGTLLRYRADITLKSIVSQILGRLFRPMTVGIVRRHMANLKRVAEAEAREGA